MDFTAVVSLDYDALALDMAEQLDYDEIVDFISTLDTFIADWSFTEAVYEWAREQHKEFLAETEDMTREAMYRG